MVFAKLLIADVPVDAAEEVVVDWEELVVEALAEDVVEVLTVDDCSEIQISIAMYEQGSKMFELDSEVASEFEDS